ncbi:NifU family protein [Methylovirgula sp. 4M-Z18]|uniref:NifU family protein n=1 Tax=Methylovirgula sp. 4M-Z18 TaxID=2293567 RepID=UPI000E2F1DC4|nr:NifU family protein [Methylovirgula sp. 4M-Z18]RFB74944.1 NifU family protein [Methylovirgula sp. 4M-Z18]
MTTLPAISLDALEAAFARIRPLILGHGGDIEIVNISADGVVSVKLLGACKACPNMAMTYVGPIRTYLMEVEGVAEVRCEQVNASQKSLDRLARRLGSRPLISV